MQINEFLARLEKVKPVRESSSEWFALCPAHEDKNPSLKITLKDDKILVRCFAGCSFHDVVLAMSLEPKDFFLDSPNANKKSNFQIGETYDYTDEDNNLLYQAVRLIPKSFRVRRPDPDKPGEWIWNLKGVKPVPYKLPEVLQAIQDGRPIIIVEGEKDVHTANALELIATCNHGGAEKWLDNIHTPYFKDAIAVIIPDKDGPGKAHAEKVAASLLKAPVKGIKIVYTPGPGKDLTDWVEAGGTRSELDATIRANDIWLPGTILPDADTIDPNAFSLSDTGQADLIVSIYHEKILYDRSRGKLSLGWHIWRDEKWQLDNTGEYIRLCQKAAGVRKRGADKIPPDSPFKQAYTKYCNSLYGYARLEAVAKTLTHHEQIACDGSEWDRNGWLLGVRNGVVDLRTGELMKNNPALRITKYVDIDYIGLDKEHHGNTRFDKFMHEIFDDDNDLITFVQKSIGYTLTAETSEQAYFMCHGIGGNGKSTLFEIMGLVLGPYAVTLPFSSFEPKAPTSIPSDLAMLRGARLLTTSEAPSSTRINEERIKALTGEGEIMARHLYGHEFNFRPKCKLWIGLNHKPNVRDDSHAFWRRVCLIPFDKIFEPRQEPDLKRKLYNELPHILSWAVRGCLYWQAEGLDRPEKVRVATKEYRAEQDDLGQFLLEKTAPEMGERIAAKTLFDHYKDWCEAQGYNEKERISRKKFGILMNNRYRTKRTESGIYYLDIRPAFAAIKTTTETAQAGKLDLG